MKINKLDSEKIFKYAYLVLIALFFAGLVYTYYFFFNNVYLTVYFDEIKHSSNIPKTDDLDTKRFNEAIRKIETKSVKKNIEINDIFN